MKRFLLSLALLCAVLFGQAQVVLNEVHPDPSISNINPARNEYIELFNTTAAKVPLDCYTLISYDNNSHTAWVYQLPAIEIEANGFLVLTSSAIRIGDPNSGPIAVRYGSGGNSQTQTYSGTNVISWNILDANSSLKKYTKSGSTLTFSSNGPTQDLMPIAQGSSATTAIFLFNGSSLVSSLVTNNGTALPGDFASLTTPLSISQGSCTASINFSTITANNVEVVASINSAPGVDKGYYRTSDGSCGTWVKMTTSQWSPGVSNGNANALATVATVSAVQNCGSTNTTPSLWDVTITVTDAAYAPAPYKIYDDIDHSKTITNGDVLISEGVITNTTPLALTGLSATRNNGIIVNVSSSSGCISAERIFEIGCAPLPITLASFKASRSGNKVSLAWETSMENNNKGFHVQRNADGEWKNIGFVASKANGGNSSAVLSYNFTDNNSHKGISQNRLLQVDIDGKSKYSEIRSVRGDAQQSRLALFPNPSSTGTITVLFEDASGLRNVVLSDAAGRVVKQYRNINNNQLVIENLTDGFYTVQVANQATGAITIEKVIVKKR